MDSGSMSTLPILSCLLTFYTIPICLLKIGGFYLLVEGVIVLLDSGAFLVISGWLLETSQDLFPRKEQHHQSRTSLET